MNNTLPDVRYPIADGMQGKNYVFCDCMAFIMERLGESQLDYWTFSWITGDGLTQIYNKNQTSFRECCVSGYRAGTEYIDYIFNAIGYDYEYVTAKQINADKERCIQKVKDCTDKGVPVLVMRRITSIVEHGGFSLYIGYGDGGDTLLSVTDSNKINKYDTNAEINQDWVFVCAKKREIAYEDIIIGAVKKMRHWLTIPEENGICYGAAAFRAWADDVEAGRFDNEPDLWANYGVYFANLATNSWANNISDAPYASLLYKFAQINPQFADMRDKIAEQFYIIGYGDGKGGIWKELEELGGGFNLSNETFQDIEKKTQIAKKLREATDCMEAIDQILQKYNICC